MTPTNTPVDPPRPRTFADATEALRGSLPNYEERPEQRRLAESIEQAWRDGSILVGQAGTGTGKSLASLIPAILSGERTVYSTATKALQSQIIEKDLPFLQQHLGVPFEYAMLQGRSNYVCHLRTMENAADNPLISQALALLTNDDERHQSAADFDFDLSGLRDSFPIEFDNVSWSKMTISPDDCPRKKCPYYESCRFQAAKAKAEMADVVVANHALVALDGRVHEMSSGNANLLAGFDHLIVDECHELEEYITSALSTQQSPGTYRSYTAELRSLFRASDLLGEHVEEIGSISMDLIVQSDRFFDAFEAGRVRHRDAVANSSTIEQLIASLSQVRSILGNYKVAELPKGVQGRFSRTQSRTDNLLRGLVDFIMKPDTEIVRMFEVEQRGSSQVKVMRVVPVRIGPWAKANLWDRVKPVLISATVLVDGRADFIADRLGFKTELDRGEVSVLDVGTPFDYDRQSRLYIPRHIPAPAGKSRDEWEVEMHEITRELVQISEGRALLLFTSRTQMEKAWREIAPHIGHPCRKQGDMPNAHLTRWFREETNSVLFATRSFFTGIDIQGESLSLVVIDKLPFPVPTEPVFEARCEDVVARGGSDFNELTVPMMALVLQQAFGRLIRTKSDRGVVAIMDPRLQTKGYGGKIQRSLPAPVTFDLNEVERFFAAMKA